MLVNKLVLTLFWAVLSAGLQADQFSKTHGDYTVHYNVFNSTFLSEAVAAQYRIVRSPQAFLLNVSVRKKNSQGGDKEHPAKVSGYINDLMRHTQLRFRQVKEKGAIYYLADVPVKYTETLKFHLKVIPEGSAHRFDIDFHRLVRPDHQ